MGCKLNFSETATISRVFASSQYQIVPYNSVADLYVINTCSVTQNADKEFGNLVKKAQKNNPNAFIAAIGCYAQLKPNEIASIQGVDLVLGATEKFKLIEFVNNLEKNEFAKFIHVKLKMLTFMRPVIP